MLTRYDNSTFYCTKISKASSRGRFWDIFKKKIGGGFRPIWVAQWQEFEIFPKKRRFQNFHIAAPSRWLQWFLAYSTTQIASVSQDQTGLKLNNLFHSNNLLLFSTLIAASLNSFFSPWGEWHAVLWIALKFFNFFFICIAIERKEKKSTLWCYST